MTPLTRLIWFLFGIAIFIGVEHVMELGGPDSPGLVLPFVGLAISLGSVLAELAVRLFHAVRRSRRAAHSSSEEGPGR